MFTLGLYRPVLSESTEPLGRSAQKLHTYLTLGPAFMTCWHNTSLTFKFKLCKISYITDCLHVCYFFYTTSFPDAYTFCTHAAPFPSACWDSKMCLLAPAQCLPHRAPCGRLILMSIGRISPRPAHCHMHSIASPPRGRATQTSTSCNN